MTTDENDSDLDTEIFAKLTELNQKTYKELILIPQKKKLIVKNLAKWNNAQLNLTLDEKGKALTEFLQQQRKQNNKKISLLPSENLIKSKISFEDLIKHKKIEIINFKNDQVLQTLKFDSEKLPKKETTTFYIDPYLKKSIQFIATGSISKTDILTFALINFIGQEIIDEIKAKET